MLRRSTIHVVDDSARMQTVQVTGLTGELSDDIERFNNYGFTSNPMPPPEDGKGAEAVVIAGDGQSSQKIVVATEDRRYRPVDQEAGDVIIYHFQDDRTATNAQAKHRISLTFDGSNRFIIARCGEGGDLAELILKDDGSVRVRAGDSSIDLNQDGITLTGTTVKVIAERVEIS